MIGNDVVDFGDPDTAVGTTHPRFDTRVFTTGELEMIRTSPEPSHFRWLLWAAKESAFKALRKSNPRLAFSPASFDVQLDRDVPPLPGGSWPAGTRSGTVLCRTHSSEIPGVEGPEGGFGEHVGFRAMETDEVLHVIARTEPKQDAPIVCGMRRIVSEDPGAAVRQLAITELALRLDASIAELRIEREHRVPHLWLRGQLTSIDLSLSHHGHFVAFAAVIEPQSSPARGSW